MADTVPILSATLPAYEIKTTSIKSGGNITSNGGLDILERGICYGFYSEPTTSNNKIIDTLVEIGSYDSHLINLELNTTYYIRAYAINSLGVGYGSQISIKTLQTPSLEEIKSLQFDYLTGQDLLRIINYQLLTKQQSIDSDSLNYSVKMAISEIKSNLISKYDIESEFEKTGNDRNLYIVKLTTICAIKNICGNSNAVNDYLASIFTGYDEEIKMIRSGQSSLNIKSVADSQKSKISIVSSTFNMIG
jgi:hypothetical protein